MIRPTGVVRPLILLPIDPFSEKIGGIKTFVRDFVRFAPADFEIEVVGCTSDPAARPIGRWRDLLIDGRAVRSLAVLETPDVHRRPLIPQSLQFTLAAMLRRSAHHFAHRVLQFHNPGVPAGFLGVDAPKVLMVHLNVADIDRGEGESRWGIVPGLLHRFEDITLPRMDRIFVVNRDGVAFYERRHPRIADRVSFLPTSVDQTAFRPVEDRELAAARSELAARIGLAPDAPEKLLLFVGRLEKQKDPDLLIDAFAESQRRRGDLHLVVVGEGGLRERAVARADASGMAGRVHWLGYQPRTALPKLMNGADALVLASAFEGMPITVLEALACGLPVASTAVGEVALVVHDGENGRLSAARTAPALADAITWVVGRPRASFVASARAAVAPYTPERVLEPFFDAHRELHHRRNPG
jgi:glycosyltransferase involved in cell wall biosynthesis